jgi:hypothetical protein
VASVLVIAGVDQTARIRWASMTAKLNTLDVTLVDPATLPELGDAVTLTNPAWAGTVAAVRRADAVDRATGHTLVTVAATNTEAATASAAPFALSDAPDNVTTFGYSRLELATAANQDGTTTTHGSCTITQPGLWPAMTFLLTSANLGKAGAGYSVSNVTVTWPTPGAPSFAVEFGDPIVTMAVWAASQAGAAPEGSIDGTRITPGTVDTPQLRANAVTAEKILAGSVTGDKLAATLLLASLIKTAAPDGSDPGTGVRVELDREGIRAYDAGDVLQVNIPTDGSPVYVRGQVSATNLVATASSLLQGTALLGVGATMTVQNNVADPTAAPVLVGSVPRLTLGTAPAHPSAGLCYDPAGDAGGGTPTFWVGATADDGGTTDVAYEYRASDGALLRTLRKTGSTQTITGATAGSTSHVSDTAEARTGSTETHIATPITMPSRDNMKITAVSVYCAGYSGDATVRNGVWDDVSGAGNLLRESASYTAASKAFSNGNSVHYNKSLTSPLSVAPGATIYAGFRRLSSTGFQWDRDDGSGKTTKSGDDYTGDGTGWGTWNSASKPNVYVTYQYDVDSSLEGPMGAIVGIARAGSSVWVLDDLGTLFQYNQADLAYVGKTTAIAAYITGAKAGAGLFWDGTNLVVTTASGTTGTDQVRLVKCTAAGAYASTLTCSGLAVNGSTATIRGGCLVNDALNGNAPTYWVAIGGAFAGAYGFVAATGANTANRDFGAAGEIAGGVAHDGTAFRGWAAAAPTSVWTFTTWDWSSATQPFWLAYSWYDDVGTVHETRVGPRASISLGRRRQLGVTLPSVPAGGAEDPSKLNLYMLAAAADPGTGSGTMKLQSTTTATQLTLTSYSSAGAADPASNNFPGGTPAVIQSQVAGWALRGDGTASLASATVTGAITRSGEAWAAPTLTNSWVNYGSSYNGAAYRKDAQGYVHLRGLIKSGTVGSAAFTLPAGFRPGGGTILHATISNSAIGRVDIATTGTVTPASPSSNGWVSLEGITFLAEA